MDLRKTRSLYRSQVAGLVSRGRVGSGTRLQELTNAVGRRVQDELPHGVNQSKGRALRNRKSTRSVVKLHTVRTIIEIQRWRALLERATRSRGRAGEKKKRTKSRQRQNKFKLPPFRRQQSSHYSNNKGFARTSSPVGKGGRGVRKAQFTRQTLMK